MREAAPRKRPSGVKLRKAERERAQAAFLDAFAASANVTAACKRAGVSRQTMYAWQEHDEAFSLRYKQAEAEACDVIRAAIHEHAIRGWDEPVVSMGKVVYVGGKPLMQHKYDSSLLAKLATARLPEFRERSREGEGASTIRIIIETDNREVGTAPHGSPFSL